jgi:chemotaxis protein MotB
MPAIGSRFRSRRSDEIWPGFVDALTTLLLVIIFVLAVFVVSQFILSQALSGRDEALAQLNRQVAEFAELLSLERRTNDELRQSIAQLSASLQESATSRDQLALRLDDVTGRLAEAETTIAADRETIAARLADIERLKRDIAALTEVRDDLEKRVGSLVAALDDSQRSTTQLRDRAAELEARLATEAERTALAQKELESRDVRLSELELLYRRSSEALETERRVSKEAAAQVDLLSRQLAAVREQLARLNDALEAAESKDREQQSVISDLGRRLNVALARKVEELSRYRSEFFGRLRDMLGERQDIRVVGDRFVFQSEVLFESASADIADEGTLQLGRLASAIKEIASRIPPEINWVLRVDGHTDRIPIATARFPSNWELSTARAVSVVKYLVEQGVPPERLAATGFGEFQPLDPRRDEIAHRRNRRIEFKLTER